MDEEVTRKVYDDISWLSSVELGIEYWPETGWKVTNETIARGLLKFSKVDIDIDVSQSEIRVEVFDKALL